MNDIMGSIIYTVITYIIVFPIIFFIVLKIWCPIDYLFYKNGIEKETENSCIGSFDDFIKCFNARKWTVNTSESKFIDADKKSIFGEKIIKIDGIYMFLSYKEYKKYFKWFRRYQNEETKLEKRLEKKYWS